MELHKYQGVLETATATDEQPNMHLCTYIITCFKICI